MSSIRLRVLSVVAPLACTAVMAAPSTAQPAALVAQLRGNVKVIAGGGGPAEPVRVGLRLELGDSLDVAPGSRATLLYNNGRLVAATSSLVVAPVGGAGAQAIHARAAASLEEARRQGRPDAAAGVGRPPPSGAYPLEPVRRVSVVAVRPTFRWQGDDGASGYTLQIRPTAGGIPRRYSVDGTGPWTLPDSAAPLTAGEEYAWTVVPAGGGRMPGEERFVVLTDGERESVTAFRAALVGAGLDPDADGGFVAAAFYADLGLLHDADQALSAFRATLPEGAAGPVVDLLATRILEGLGRTDEALEAFERATGGGG